MKPDVPPMVDWCVTWLRTADLQGSKSIKMKAVYEAVAWMSVQN